jgi:hypothetical protein
MKEEGRRKKEEGGFQTGIGISTQNEPLPEGWSIKKNSEDN